MHFAYIDESGDNGSKPGASSTFSLACVLVEASEWPDVFDNVIDFRRFLRTRFRVPVRGEIKANHLLQNRGIFRKLQLSERARFAVYRACLRLQPKLKTQVFAVVIRKQVMIKQGRTEDPRAVAWEYLIQRLERFTTKGRRKYSSSMMRATPRRFADLLGSGDG